MPDKIDLVKELIKELVPATNVYYSQDFNTEQHTFAIGEPREERRLVLGHNFLSDHEFDVMKPNLTDAIQRLAVAEYGKQITLE